MWGQEERVGRMGQGWRGGDKAALKCGAEAVEVSGELGLWGSHTPRLGAAPTAPPVLTEQPPMV